MSISGLQGRIPGSQTNFKEPLSKLKVLYVGFLKGGTTIWLTPILGDGNKKAAVFRARVRVLRFSRSKVNLAMDGLLPSDAINRGSDPKGYKGSRRPLIFERKEKSGDDSSTFYIGWDRGIQE